MAGIYIHIPFCVQKCLYCDFISSKSCKADMDEYQSAILNEIGLTEIDEEIDSIFFGGGTPSLYPEKYIAEILDKLREKYNVNRNSEITIEVNPGTITNEKLICYSNAGINRISIGLQSTNDEELKALGRIHNYEQFLTSYEMIRNARFTNVNIDLMSAIPGQNLESYKKTLERIVELNPEHISAYSLIIEEGTPFYEKYGEGKPFENELPDEEIDREIYHFTKEYLEKNGYKRYEISNYSKENLECKHNLKYWERANYYGFGVAASSLVGDIRYTNISDREKYIEYKGDIKLIRNGIEKLSEKDKMSEFMFLGLRKTKGISVSAFNKIFTKKINEVYGNVIEKNVKIGLLAYEDDYIKLTEKGLDVCNIVMSEML